MNVAEGRGNSVSGTRQGEVGSVGETGLLETRKIPLSCFHL